MRQPPENSATGSRVRARRRSPGPRAASPRARAPRSRRSRRSAACSSASARPSSRARASAAASARSTSRSSRVAVQHELERRARRPRASPARRARSPSAAAARRSPASGVQLAADQREEARLAAAVGADEADLVARVDGQRRAFEQALRAAGERQVGDAIMAIGDHAMRASRLTRRLVVVVDDERRVVGEAPVRCRSTRRARARRCPASRSGSRCASRRSSPTPAPRFDHHV